MMRPLATRMGRTLKPTSATPSLIQSTTTTTTTTTTTLATHPPTRNTQRHFASNWFEPKTFKPQAKRATAPPAAIPSVPKPKQQPTPPPSPLVQKPNMQMSYEQLPPQQQNPQMARLMELMAQEETNTAAASARTKAGPTTTNTPIDPFAKFETKPDKTKFSFFAKADMAAVNRLATKTTPTPASSIKPNIQQHPQPSSKQQQSVEKQGEGLRYRSELEIIRAVNVFMAELRSHMTISPHHLEQLKELRHIKADKRFVGRDVDWMLTDLFAELDPQFKLNNPQQYNSMMEKFNSGRVANGEAPFEEIAGVLGVSYQIRKYFIWNAFSPQSLPKYGPSIRAQETELFKHVFEFWPRWNALPKHVGYINRTAITTESIFTKAVEKPHPQWTDISDPKWIEWEAQRFAQLHQSLQYKGATTITAAETTAPTTTTSSTPITNTLTKWFSNASKQPSSTITTRAPKRDLRSADPSHHVQLASAARVTHSSTPRSITTTMRESEDGTFVAWRSITLPALPRRLFLLFALQGSIFDMDLAPLRFSWSIFTKWLLRKFGASEETLNMIVWSYTPSLENVYRFDQRKWAQISAGGEDGDYGVEKKVKSSSSMGSGGYDNEQIMPAHIFGEDATRISEELGQVKTSGDVPDYLKDYV